MEPGDTEAQAEEIPTPGSSRRRVAPVAEGFPGGGTERRKSGGARTRGVASGKRTVGSCPAATEGRSATEALHRQTLGGFVVRPDQSSDEVPPTAPSRRRVRQGAPATAGREVIGSEAQAEEPANKRNEVADLSATRAGGFTAKAQAGEGNPKATGERRGVPANPDGAGGAARFHRPSRKARAASLERRIGGAPSAPRPDARQAEGSRKRERGMRDSGRFGWESRSGPYPLSWPAEASTTTR